MGHISFLYILTMLICLAKTEIL